MSGFDFRPSITDFKFYKLKEGSGEDEVFSKIKLKEYKEGDPIDTFEIGIQLTLNGLDYLRNPLLPIEDSYMPFYLHIATYTQRGQRDFVVDGVWTQYVDQAMMEKGTLYLKMPLLKFNNAKPLRFEDDKKDFKYDFVSNILYLKVFITQNPIENSEELQEEMFQTYNLLFQTKIPKIDTKAWEWNRNESDS